MVNYAYDAWGNHKVLDASGNAITATAHIGHRNPFRHRGYFYDRETGLYYLKSRYYDPQTGRFINMDSVRLSAMFGFAGGAIGITKWGKGIRNIIVGTGLGLGESSIGEIIERWQSRQKTNMPYLRLAY